MHHSFTSSKVFEIFQTAGTMLLGGEGGEGRKHTSFAENYIRGVVSSYSFKPIKWHVNSGTGIAVILTDDLLERKLVGKCLHPQFPLFAAM